MAQGTEWATPIREARGGQNTGWGGGAYKPAARYCTLLLRMLCPLILPQIYWSRKQYHLDFIAEEPESLSFILW